MERHPLSSQTFYPLDNSNYIVIVAERGEFDVQSLKAFIALSSQGVNYAKGTWHHYCQSIGSDCKFLVIDRKGQGNNCDEVFLEQSMQIMVSI
jgi:ureidoglycolate lyase